VRHDAQLALPSLPVKSPVVTNCSGNDAVLTSGALTMSLAATSGGGYAPCAPLGT